MPTFTYTGITAAGQQIDGVVEAFDEIEAMERAREQCRVVRSEEHTSELQSQR